MTNSPSLKTLAKLTGFSVSTVSRALNDHVGTSQEAKQIIRDAANKVGYKRNAVISMLTAQLRSSRLQSRKSTLAYLTTLKVPGILPVNAMYPLFYKGAKARAEQLGYGLDLIWRMEDRMTSPRMTKILQSRGIQGLLIAPRRRPLGHFALDWSRFSAVSIGHPLPGPELHMSGASHYRIMGKALRTIRKYGYHRVGNAVLPVPDGFSNYTLSSRFLIYQGTIPEKDRVPLLSIPGSGAQVTRADFEAWFLNHRPEVLLHVGPEVPRWIREMNFSVPGDVALVDLCLDDESGECAGVYEMPEVIAANAVDLLIEQLHNNERGVPLHPKSVLTEGRWVDGVTLPIQRH